jgi:MOSC domain-containing protein YiiM
MQLISVNIGRERAMANAKRYGKTGIYKEPGAGLVEITPLGIRDDIIVDTQNHGGFDQAIYIYGAEDYDWWSQTLGKELSPGTFGENLTIRGLESADCLVGDRFRMGNVVLEATCPRIPCVTLAVRMGDAQFVKRFRNAGRPGLYCRVIQAGFVQAGQTVTYSRYEGEQLSMLEMFETFYQPRRAAEYLRRYLAVPSPLKGRAEIETELRVLLDQADG